MTSPVDSIVAWPGPVGPRTVDRSSGVTTDHLIDTIAADGGWLSQSDSLCFDTILEAIMTAILALALTLGLGSPAPAADDKTADPVGTWKCEYEIGGQQRTSTLMVMKDGDKLVGTMSWSDQKDEKIKDPQFKDGKLMFSAVRKIMDNEIPIDYTLTIDGDQLKGKGSADFDGEKREWDIEGKREKKDK